MDNTEALRIIAALRDGVHPITGEGIGYDQTLQHPEIVRALFIASQSLERVIGIDSRKGMLPPKSGMSWNDAEDQELISGFESGHSISMLAKAHQRTAGAITARLERLGKIAVGTFQRGAVAR